MLVFVVEYQDALKVILSDIDYNLRRYQLTKEEWKHAEELAQALNVRFPPLLCFII